MGSPSVAVANGRRWFGTLGHGLADGCHSYIVPEIEQIAVNAGCAPKWVFDGQPMDQIREPGERAIVPRPEESGGWGGVSAMSGIGGAPGRIGAKAMRIRGVD
jgi:hypothetical protein